jgi:Integrase core domain
MQNGYIESLNEQWFQSVPHARTCIAEWRRDHNEVRPYYSLGRITGGSTSLEYSNYLTYDSYTVEFEVDEAIQVEKSILRSAPHVFLVKKTEKT